MPKELPHVRLPTPAELEAYAANVDDMVKRLEDEGLTDKVFETSCEVQDDIAKTLSTGEQHYAFLSELIGFVLNKFPPEQRPVAVNAIAQIARGIAEDEDYLSRTDT